MNQRATELAKATEGTALEWASFLSLDNMQNHWERPGWTPGRRAYYWYATFSEPVVTALAARYQDHLQGLPYLDAVPLDSLHLTVQRLAFEDEIDPARVTRAQEVARREISSMPVLPLNVGPLTGSAGAVRLSVDPWDDLQHLRSRLQTAVRDAGIPTPERGSVATFRPHIGISYCNAHVPAAPLQRLISRLRSEASVPTLIDQVDLVLLRREGRAYRWDTIDTIPLYH